MDVGPSLNLEVFSIMFLKQQLLGTQFIIGQAAMQALKVFMASHRSFFLPFCLQGQSGPLRISVRSDCLSKTHICPLPESEQCLCECVCVCVFSCCCWRRKENNPKQLPSLRQLAVLTQVCRTRSRSGPDPRRLCGNEGVVFLWRCP